MVMGVPDGWDNDASLKHFYSDKFQVNLRSFFFEGVGCDRQFCFVFLIVAPGLNSNSLAINVPVLSSAQDPVTEACMVRELKDLDKQVCRRVAIWVVQRL